jgi:phosphoglycolate phosphatase
MAEATAEASAEGMTARPALLFDLDGTLSDPVVGISRSLQHAMVRLGREPPDAAALRRFVGPPLRAIFAELLATDDPALIASAVAFHRERFATIGLYENVIHPGIAALLRDLAEEGHRLFIVTSKPHIYARRILDHFGIGGWFGAIYGPELDGRNSEKTELVALALERERLTPAATWMIGDRAVDVEGGRANGTRTAAVLWGCGDEAELRAAAPDLLAHTVGELHAGLRRARLASAPSP